MTARSHGGLPLLVALLEIVVVAVFVATFLFEPARIPSASMEPSLRVGDLVLLDRQAYAPAGRLDRLFLPPARVRRSDIAVFRIAEGRLSETGGHTLLVKRVAGLPGESVRLVGGRLLVDGSPVAEPYAFYALTSANPFRDSFPSLREVDPAVDPRWWAYLRRNAASGSIAIPPASYFVLGDNRNDSEDSRYWGFVASDSLIGRPVFRYWRAGTGWRQWLGRVR